jgi:hypothetical protein
VHVPVSRQADTAVTLRKQTDRRYGIDPFPFADDALALVCRGRHVMPFGEDFPPDRVGAALRELPLDRQTYELVAER